jgi:fibronectin type III domain protein
MPRRAVLGAVACTLIFLGAASAAGATTTSLLVPQSSAFSILGHSCGGIQEQAFATGFDLVSGHPAGDVYLQTRCGGSGRGGGYKVTTYSAWAGTTWSWFGEARTVTRLEGEPAGLSATFTAEDAFGDRLYNTLSAVNVLPQNCTVGNTSYCTYRAYLETGEPPLTPPAAPAEVAASLIVPVDPEQPTPEQFQVSWTPAAATAAQITSSTVTATPVGSSAPVLSATVSGTATSALVGPLQPATTYAITVTNTDAEGTSPASSPIEAKSASGEEEPPPNTGIEPPDFGRCTKAPGEKEGGITVYSGAFTTSGCLEESATQTGKFEWSPGILNGGFTTAIKPTTIARLESVSKAKVTCTGESGSGAVTGANAVSSVQIRLSGCESAGAKCTTSGLAEGELASAYLEGVLGIERITFKEEKEIRHVALELYPAGHAGPFLEYTCAGSEQTTLDGSVLAPVVAGRMLTSTTFKLAASGGKQKPEGFEGGEQAVLRNSLGEQVGLTLAATQTNEEATEINPSF